MSDSFVNIISPLFALEDFDDGTDKKAEIMIQAAMHHHVFMLFYSQLKKACRNRNHKHADGIINRYQGQYMSVVANAIRQEMAENLVVSILERRHLPSLVIKGNAIARDVYQKLYTRNSSDIDILIREKDCFSVDAILRREGYRILEKEPLAFCITRKHHASYQCPKSKFLVEMHWNFSIPGFFDLTSEEIWECVVPGPGKNAALSPEMILIQLLMHNAMHGFRELRIFADILWTMYRFNDSINWFRFAQTLKKTGLLKTAYISLDQIIKIWGEPIKAIDAISTLFSEIKKQLMVHPVLLSRFFQYDLRHKKDYQHNRDQFFVRLALDRPGNIIRAFVKSFFPTPREIRVLYQDNRNWMIPVYYFRFARWRVSQWIR